MNKVGNEFSWFGWPDWARNVSAQFFGRSGKVLYGAFSIVGMAYQSRNVNNGIPDDLFVCLFVCDPQPHFSRGVNSQRRTYGDHPLPPRPLVTPGPCVSVCSLSPHTFVLNASCIRSVPSPVLLSYTYTLSSLWSVSLSYTYIQTP